jgi:hypothetical protein
LAGFVRDPIRLPNVPVSSADDLRGFFREGPRTSESAEVSWLCLRFRDAGVGVKGESGIGIPGGIREINDAEAEATFSDKDGAPTIIPAVPPRIEVKVRWESERTAYNVASSFFKLASSPLASPFSSLSMAFLTLCLSPVIQS